MSPTPTSSLPGYSRQFPRSRRPRNANPYDAAHNLRPVTRPTPPARVVTPASEPTLDEGDDEDDTQDMDDADAEAEDEEVADVVDITEEIDDGNGDGEGAIEEGERGLSKWSNQEPFESLLNPICAPSENSEEAAKGGENP